MHPSALRKAVVDRWVTTPTTREHLARDYGIHRSTVLRWTVGLKKRRSRGLDPQELIRLEREEGMRRSQIAARYGVTKSAVTKAITRHLER